jgi:hypothetical protein
MFGQPCFMTFITKGREVCLSELTHMHFLRHNTCSDFQILLMRCFSYVLHMQFLTYHTHAISLLSYIFRFRISGLSQIPQIFRFSDITTLCIATNFMSKQVFGNHTCSFSQILRMCLFCNMYRMESPQLSHMSSFQASQVCAVFCVLSRVSIHFNTQFHGNVRWCRRKALQILGLGPNETVLSVSKPGPFTYRELTPVQSRLATELGLEPF